MTLREQLAFGSTGRLPASAEWRRVSDPQAARGSMSLNDQLALGATGRVPRLAAWRRVAQRDVAQESRRKSGWGWVW